MNTAQTWSTLLLVVALAAPGSCAAAVVIDLVTPAEVARDRAAPVQPAPKAAPDPAAPRIEVAAPDLNLAAIATPFAIVVRFVPAPDQRIEPATLRVLYGRLGLDITSRILGAARVTAAGLEVQNARIPPGTHRLTIEIRDDAANMARRELVFQVVE